MQDRLLAIVDTAIMLLGFIVMLLSPDAATQIAGACLVGLGLLLLIIDG